VGEQLLHTATPSIVDCSVVEHGYGTKHYELSTTYGGGGGGGGGRPPHTAAPSVVDYSVAEQGCGTGHYAVESGGGQPNNPVVYG
jgi:hypothetical protein